MKPLLPSLSVLMTMLINTSFAANEGLIHYRLGAFGKAIAPLSQDAEKDPVSSFYLGQLYLYGYGTGRNVSLAMAAITRSAEKGYIPGQWWLGRYFLLNGRNPEEAFKWFKKAADAGDELSKVYVAGAYLYGYGTKKQPEVAKRYYIDAAKMGNTWAQYILASNFLSSRAPQNKKMGLIWLQKSAKAGNPRALVRLSKMYTEGLGVEKDPVMANELLATAIKNHYVPALILKGEMSLATGDFTKAKSWFEEANKPEDPRAQMKIASLYIDEKSPMFDAHQGFLMVLKSAESGYPDAIKQLASLYENGIGTSKDPFLAKTWAAKIKTETLQESKLKLARYLTNDRNFSIQSSAFALQGIMRPWLNPNDLKDYHENPAPMLGTITRQMIFKPEFVVMKPNDIPVTDYFDTLLPMLKQKNQQSFVAPRYAINSDIEALLQKNDLGPKKFTGAFIIYEPALYPSATAAPTEVRSSWVPIEKKQQYQHLLERLYEQAILGDTSAQFELGQLYEYGIGVKQDLTQAITYYELAAEQQDVRSEYNLGILYLEHYRDKASIEKGAHWLMDAAYKGNANAQYVLAHLYENGIADETGKEVFAKDQHQSEEMFYLASANAHGLAQFELADHLVSEPLSDLSLEAREKRIQTIRELYASAEHQGVKEASIPLAFYNAMSRDPQKRIDAFLVAKAAANTGNPSAALLVGLMSDRGIGTQKNPGDAYLWYQKASSLPLAQFVLGTYAVDKGDLPAGKNALKIASDAGFSWAKYNLAVLRHDGHEPFTSLLDEARASGNARAGLLLADYYMAEASDPAKMQEAAGIYQHFAEKGDRDAALKLGYLNDTGLSGQVNVAEAERWYHEGAVQHQPMAEYLLAQLYQSGRLGEPDYEKAKTWYHLAAAHYPSAYVALGFIQEWINEDYVAAKASYQSAADKGVRSGMYNLGLFYDEGKGNSVDPKLAEIYYQKAADLGSSFAMTRLAKLLFDQKGSSVSQAVHWYEKAAALGNQEALYQMGLLYESGIAVKLDFKQARFYYQEAASKGNQEASLALARMYQYGLGISKDPEQAFQMYQKLAQNQNAYAQYQLSRFYFNGTLGEKLPEQGEFWLEKASQGGFLPATAALRLHEAESKTNVSYVEPVVMLDASVIGKEQPDYLYMNALRAWNRGEEVHTRLMLNRLLIDYPEYAPAKNVYRMMTNNQAEGGTGVGHS